MARRWKRGAIVASGAIAAGAWALLVHGGSDLPAGAAVSRPGPSLSRARYRRQTAVIPFTAR